MSRPKNVRADFRDEADFVIIGTGAGGATAARVLAGAGLDVLMLEEGPNLKIEERPREAVDALRTALREFGTTTSTGLAPIPFLQGCMVGGSTAINSGIIWRIPEDVRRDWIERFGLAELVEEKALSRAFEIIEDELEVEVTRADVLGGNSERMAIACEKLGLPGKPITRNARRCVGANNCLQGCPEKARQSMDNGYVPRAMRDGARLHDLMRVERILIEDGRAVGARGVTLDKETRQPVGDFVVRARRAVIVAGGAIQTPVLLRKSGLGGMVGERFQAHPGAAMVGRFPDAPIGMGYGATQGYEVPMRSRGFKIESLSLPPEMLATRIPGVGAEWQERLANLDQFAQWAVQSRFKAQGTVRPGIFGGARIRYEPLRSDVAQIQDALSLMVRMMFAAGATEVYPGLGGGIPEILTSPDQADLILNMKWKPGDIHLVASHLFGTACAANDRSKGAVRPDLSSWEVHDLYVMDACVFPTNMGVNPQHTIMGLVYRAAEQLANRERFAKSA
jgi:choline dehydrogenase-like flavoprotein